MNASHCSAQVRKPVPAGSTAGEAAASRRPSLRGMGLLLAAAITLAGCASKVKLDEPPVETRTPILTDGSGTSSTSASASAGTSAAGAAGAQPVVQSQVTTVDLNRLPSDAAGAANLGRTVYFDFDSFVVKDEYRSLIDGHARALSANRARRLMIEGHTDERGGREYNLALGQKRAEAVAKSLVLLGATDNQLEAVSFGKERPADASSNEAAWAKNRRVEIKDR
jgi:peptidoglycan-associated lipoprotein